VKKLLFLNACVNRGTSRTLRLGKELISLLKKSDGFYVSELVLEEENIPALTSETLNKRLELSKAEGFSNEIFRYAKQFKEVDCVVIAAPHWDEGFPAILKTYFEAISVMGITFEFLESGAVGLCKAKELYYVTTRGGYTTDEKDLGFSTVAALSKAYGIKETKCISVNGLDFLGNDVESVLMKAIEDLPNKI